MASFLPAGVVGLFIGFLLGVLCMALLAASDRDRLPEPPPVRTHAVHPARPEVSVPSWAAGRGNMDVAEEVAGATAREYA
ncbi:MAG: hypothetical protein H6Q86_818 [candidate division NC10 bacterium]|jgi:hypothetical protein|nr:hypothetical protein [candidate division NC10 bacterium]